MSCLINIGLYRIAIGEAYEKCEEVFQNLCLENEIDALNELWLEKLKEDNIFSYYDPTNACIELLFDAAKTLLVTNYPNLDVDYWPDWGGIETSADEIVGKLRENNVCDTIIKEVILNRLYNEFEDKNLIELCQDIEVLLDVSKIVKSGNDFVFYENTEELGADHRENGCRESDDTDESFGLFLLQSYKDGNSNTLYFEFSDGRILAADMK